MSDMSAQPDAGAVESTGAVESGGQEQAAGGGFDFAPVLDRIGSMQESFEQRFSRLENPPAPPEPEVDPYAPLEEMDLDPGAAQELRQMFSQMNNAAFQQALGPLQQQLKAIQEDNQKLRRELDAGDLEQRIPAFERPEYVQQTMEQAAQWAQRAGVSDPGNVAFIEMTALAELGRQALAKEQPAGGHTELESAAGANPGEPEPDIAANIVAARRANPGASVFGI